MNNRKTGITTPHEPRSTGVIGPDFKGNAARMKDQRAMKATTSERRLRRSQGQSAKSSKIAGPNWEEMNLKMIKKKLDAQYSGPDEKLIHNLPKLK